MLFRSIEKIKIGQNPITEVELIKKEIKVLRESESNKADQNDTLFENNIIDNLQEKIEKQNEYLYQMTRYINEINKEKEIMYNSDNMIDSKDIIG